ncbi:hypothetical protein BKG71_19435 [Mycobacteroides chelonae]|uniref:hypothetical protein n=1 Tax=Mycobacteroides chelonae TaxID=1774 RepID=UPI0008A9502F|nr:hypothetical protein [Mycobacteroides chelonae]OHT98292.1 hypothetical protein BKG71_19435 [Mycobacteroides chelonae]
MTQHDDDPFAPKTEEAPKAQSDNPVSSDAGRPVVRTEADGKVVVTLKGGASFSDPWIVIHANSVDDADSQMDAKLAALMEKTQKVAKKFVELGGAAPTATPTPTSNVPAGAQSAPNNETRQCKHGAMTYKTGSKGGRTWKAFMCPTPKGAPDQCEPQWIRD